MLHYVTFSNFFSFRDKQIVDFRVNQKAPFSDAYVDSRFDVRLGKVLVCFGPNASGKTNALKVLSFISWLLTKSFTEEPEESLPYLPYLFGDIDVSNITVEFEIGSHLYRYNIQATLNQIGAESLFVRHDESSNFSYIFKREWNPGESKYDISYNRTSKFSLPDDFQAPMTRTNASLISIGAHASEPLCELIRSYWSKVNANVTPFRRTHSDLDGEIMNATKFFSANDRFFEEAKRHLCDWDLGINDIQIKKFPSLDKSELLYPLFRHKAKLINGTLPVFYESDGTRSLYLHLARLLPILNSGGLCVIDELEADLHPLIIPKIIDLFLSPTTNSQNAQFIGTCHSAPVMNHLDKYQILLAEKIDSESSIYRLDKIQGVRLDDNYFAKYMAGAYGATPQT